MFGEWVDAKLRAYLESWHGAPDDPMHQVAYHRCLGCHKLVTWRSIRNGGCPCGMSNKVRGAVLRPLEKLRLLLAPWSYRA